MRQETTFDGPKCPATHQPCTVFTNGLAGFTTLEPTELREQNLGERCLQGFKDAKSDGALEVPVCGLEYMRQSYNAAKKGGDA